MPYQKIMYQIWWFFYRVFFVPWDMTYEETIEFLDTPFKVQAWMYSNLKYNWLDIFNTWQPPRETFESGWGDCEDWAVFAYECLKDDYDSCVVVVYHMIDDIKSGHAFCAVKVDEDDWITVGTFGLRKHKGETVEDFLDYWYEDWSEYKILTEDDLDL